jgi:SAM-dependent methyltransferase
MMLDLSRYIDDQRLWGRHGFAALDWQCRELLGVSQLRGRVLEIGAGEGLMSLWMLHAGARSVTSLEPEAAGATDGVAARAEAHRRALNVAREEWDYRPDTLQTYTGEGGYSLILSHASVNHLDEEACVRLREDPAARARYVELFRKVRDLLEPGGLFVLADVARENYWAKVGRKSPWAPEIEWEKHQEPMTWGDVLADAGLRTVSWSWFHPFYGTRRLAPLLRNRLAARLLASMFLLRARRPAAVG